MRKTVVFFPKGPGGIDGGCRVTAIHGREDCEDTPELVLDCLVQVGVAITVVESFIIV